MKDTGIRGKKAPVYKSMQRWRVKKEKSEGERGGGE